MTPHPAKQFLRLNLDELAAGLCHTGTRLFHPVKVIDIMLFQEPIIYFQKRPLTSGPHFLRARMSENRMIDI